MTFCKEGFYSVSFLEDPVPPQHIVVKERDNGIDHESCDSIVDFRE